MHFSSIEAVNAYVNGFRYIPDIENYGVSDYWATPAEFIQHGGGDCEDFAIMKYEIIKYDGLGRDLYFLLVYDTRSVAYHLVLVVDGKVLDNQYKDVYGINDKIMARYVVIRTIRP